MTRLTLLYDADAAADVGYASACEFLDRRFAGCSPARRAELLTDLGPHIQAAILCYVEAVSGVFGPPPPSAN